jgi:small subunit ribosomal protein S20
MLVCARQLQPTFSYSLWRPVLPNTKSAEKRVRTNEKRALRNRQARSRLRTALKKVRQADNPEAVATAFREVTALLDRAAARRLIHPNKAARHKSRLSKLVSERTAATTG